MLTVLSCRVSEPISSLWNGQKQCHPSRTQECSPEEICVAPAQGETNQAFCHPRYSGATPFLRFPFHPNDPVQCIPPAKNESPRINNLNAIHLVPTKKSKVYASIDGIALRFSNGPKQHVRIVSPEGYLVFYQNLSSVWIEDGQPVKTGSVLGEINNQTLVWSIHPPHSGPWLEQLASRREQNSVDTLSIAFETQFCDPKNQNECKRIRKRSESIPCYAKPSNLIRADWRD